MTTSRAVPRFAPWMGVFLVSWTSLVATGCMHDWDEWLPTGASGGSGGSTSGTGGTSTSTSGTGGSSSGGGSVPGTCPTSGTGVTALVKLATLGGTAECIEASEVTRGQYETWLTEGGVPSGLPVACGFNTEYEPVADWPPGGVGLDRPIAHVDWCDALAYCLDKNRRLCGKIGGGSLSPSDANDATQSEWFNACTNRGERLFPYGQDYGPTTCNGTHQGLNSTADVASLSGCVDASGDVFDLSGNVWEWEGSCNAEAGISDDCRIRGGGYNNGESNMNCGANATAKRDGTAVNVGFRCCADPQG
jgi:hypothetical protein